MTDHFWFNFNVIKHFSIVNTNDRTDHFWNNDHVTEMGLYWLWFFILQCLCLGST